eukprot:1057172-Rhodomonas_salina.1
MLGTNAGYGATSRYLTPAIPRQDARCTSARASAPARRNHMRATASLVIEEVDGGATVVQLK